MTYPWDIQYLNDNDLINFRYIFSYYVKITVVFIISMPAVVQVKHSTI